MTVHVISGYMRSGTSMMMAALEAGGMEACYRQSRDEMKARFADEHYDPNVGGLYELERADYADPTFPEKYEGKLIKALRMGPAGMKVMPDIRVVFMRRDYESIRQSYGAFFGQHKGFRDVSVEYIKSDVEKSLEAIRNRRDTRLMELHYECVIEHPEASMWRVATFFDFPLDVKAAAAVVDGKYNRFAKETLTAGVL